MKTTIKQSRLSFIKEHINDVNIFDFLIEYMDYKEAEEGGGYIIDREPMKIHRSQLDMQAISEEIASDDKLFVLWLEDEYHELAYIKHLEAHNV